jgi:hypothetical protein
MGNCFYPVSFAFDYLLETERGGKKMANRSKIKFVLLLLFLVAGLLSMGCALGVTRVKLNHDPLNRIENKKNGNILITQFKDVRPQAKEYIGNKRNMYGMVMGHIGTEPGVSLTEILTKYFAEALREAGYSVVIAEGSKTVEESGKIKFGAMIEGEISEFWMDLYMAVWHKVAVKLTVKNPDSKETLWEKVIRGEQKNVLKWGTTSEYEQVIQQALTQALNNAAVEFASEEFRKVVKVEKPLAGKEPPKRKEILEVDRQSIEEEKMKSTATISSVPLPEYKISPAPSKALPEIKRLLGKWQGYWKGGVPAVVVVEKVFPEAGKADCIYAWGFWGPNKENKPGYNRLSAMFIPGSKPEIRFTLGMRNYNFILEGKLLNGTGEYQGNLNKIVMEKVE